MLTRGENEGPAKYSTGQNWRGLSGVKDAACTALCSQQGLPDSVEGFVRGRKEKRERHLMDRLLWEGKGLELEETCLWVTRDKDFHFVPEPVLTLLLFPSPDAVLHACPVHLLPARLQSSP